MVSCAFVMSFLALFAAPYSLYGKLIKKKHDFDGCSKWPASIHRGCLAYQGLSGIV